MPSPSASYAVLPPTARNNGILRAIVGFLLSVNLWQLVRKRQTYSAQDHHVMNISGGSSASVAYEIGARVYSSLPDFTACRARTQKDLDVLRMEIAAYEKDTRFDQKKKEAMGLRGLDARAQSIVNYLKDEVLQPNWKILELGCASGTMLREVQKVYDGGDIGEYKDLVGVELVTGWVKWAQSYYPTIGNKIHVYEGDITDFELPQQSGTFDFVMMNDVMEHIMKDRYGCFYEKLQDVTHPGSIVYMHTPTPQAQLHDNDQFFENVLPHHHVVLGMASAGFELVTFQHDVGTNCGNPGQHMENLPRQLRKSYCIYGGWTKYYHAVFVRRSLKERDVFALQ